MSLQPAPASPDRLLRRLWTIAIIATLLICLWYLLPVISQQLAPPASKSRVVTARGDLAEDEKSTIALFENARDSVVFISTAELVADLWSRNVFEVPRGTGSGFIWDDAGHVVTNYHVIAGASQARVRLADGRDYEAALVGASPAHDIAVLRIGINFRRPPPVPIGTSGDLKIGQKVFAIGNPFGLDWTLTTGIVSALDRSLPDEDGRSRIDHLIQTDAAINPGNSGGPLLDSAGRLIGINTAIFSPSGASAGIGFAVPVDTVNRVVPQLIRSGRYIRPSLGILGDEAANAVLQQRTGIEGVFVLGVEPGSPAARAGITGMSRNGEAIVPGDIIVALDGKPVTRLDELIARLDDRMVGEDIEVTLQRDAQQRRLRLTLAPGS